MAILPSGTITAPVSPARAAYAAAEAAVLPVEAQITASAPSRTAAETAHVIPRSLNEPVGFSPSYLSHTSAPTRSETRSARISGVEPSQQRDDRVLGREREPVAVALDQPDAHQCVLRWPAIGSRRRTGTPPR